MYKGAGVILIYNNRLLCVYGKTHNKWSVPKGHKNDDETLEQCAIRELKEETDICVDIETCEKFNKNIKLKHLYYVKYIDTEPAIHINDINEIGLVRWFLPEQLATFGEYSANNDLRRIISFFGDNLYKLKN